MVVRDRGAITPPWPDMKWTSELPMVAATWKRIVFAVLAMAIILVAGEWYLPQEYQAAQLEISSDLTIARIPNGMQLAELQVRSDPCMDPLLMDRPINFSDTSQRYLFYDQTNDHCAGLQHQTWSLSCAVAEAKYLNRIFVLDFDMCLHRGHIRKSKDEIKDKRMVYNSEGLRKIAVPKKSFLCAQDKWKKENNQSALPRKVISDPIQSPDLANETDVVLVRRFPAHASYWYSVCNSKSPFKRDYSLLPVNVELVKICEKMKATLGYDYDAVHIRRGDKAARKDMWPHLEEDTRPEKLLKTLPKFVKPGRTLYIATDERSVGFFDPLRSVYSVYTIEDFSHLWANGSTWYEAAMELSMQTGKQNLNEFDNYLQALVDSCMMRGANTTVETFNDLTSDSKHGQKHGQ